MLRRSLGLHGLRRLEQALLQQRRHCASAIGNSSLRAAINVSDNDIGNDNGNDDSVTWGEFLLMFIPTVSRPRRTGGGGEDAVEGGGCGGIERDRESGKEGQDKDYLAEFSDNSDILNCPADLTAAHSKAKWTVSQSPLTTGDRAGLMEAGVLIDLMEAAKECRSETGVSIGIGCDNCVNINLHDVYYI